MKTMFKLKTSALAMVFGVTAMGLSTPSVQAQSTFDVSVLAGACANCHGTDGRSPGGMPSLAGRPESALKARLLAFKSNNPPAGTTVMNRLAKGYTDEELAALAKHFSQIKPQVARK